jgi:1-acyl-sn-glycerol-3-phosphate acyltransferase
LSELLAHVRATLVAGWVFLYVFTGGAVTVLHALWTGRIERLYGGAVWCVRAGLRLAGIRIEVHGLESLRRGQCIYMANHQSNVDPPILLAVLPERIAMMAKKQLFSIPVLGTALRLGDFVPVRREVSEEARASVEEALKTLERSGVSLMVYPEGTRSYDGRLLPFKRGVFVLAIRSGLPIVPLTLEGAINVMPKKRWVLHPGVVRVTIHPPVETRRLTLEDRHQLAEQVRAIVASALPAEQRGVAEPSAVAVAMPRDES